MTEIMWNWKAAAWGFTLGGALAALYLASLCGFCPAVLSGLLRSRRLSCGSSLEVGRDCSGVWQDSCWCGQPGLRRCVRVAGRF